MYLKHFSSILLLLIAISINAQEKEQQNIIDTFIIDNLSKFQEIPSLSIAVVKDGKPFFMKSYGLSDVEKGTKASSKTAYYIASATKSFVGLLALKLSQKGILDLNTPITEYAPIKNFKNKSVFKGISITDLLSHTSGIVNNSLTYRYASEGNYEREDLIYLLRNKTQKMRSKSYRYDNLGYNILDIILQEEFNINWKNSLREEIFSPLNMNTTSAYLSKGRKSGWDIAQPYTSINDGRKPTLPSARKNDATFQAAGGMISSISDMQNWLLMNINNGALNDKQLFSKDMISKSHSNISKTRGRSDIFKNIGYGYGWNNGIFGQKKAVYHFGGYDGYFAHVSLLPKEKMGVVILVNESHFGDNVANLIASFTYDLLLNNISSIKEYTKKMLAVQKRINQLQSAFANDRVFRSKRQWTLKKPLSSHTGKYYNPDMGMIKIDYSDEKLHVNIGVSNTIATPSANDDSIRIEARDGRGTDILFVYKNKKPHAVVYYGKVFYKK